MNAYIEIRDVHKSFGDNAVLKGIHLDVERGELITLLGPSGCGKSTLLRAVAGLIDVDEGMIFLDGRNVTNVDVRKRRVGMVFQSYALFPNLTAAKNVAFGLDIQKCPKDEKTRKVNQMLDLVGLSGKAHQRPSQLSGGQQQRVALARALVLEPKVLLLDEPLSALDAQIRQSLRMQIREIQQDMRITAIFVTHDQEEAMAISDRVCVMYGGVIEQQGAPEEIYKRPLTEFVARFIGHYNVLTPEEAEKVFGISGKSAKVVAVRPEAIDFEPGGDRLSFSGRVTRTSMLGGTVRYRLDCAGVEMNAECVNHERRYLNLGETVTCYVHERNILYIER
jgi:putative spermidine/putrescine transport system ATP-binding protein